MTLYTSLGYIGFDAVSCQVEEARRPERDVPIALILSLAISTLLYVGVSLVLTGMVPYHLIDVHAPLSTAFTNRGHQWAGVLIAIGAVVGMTSVLLVTIMAQPRIFLAMSRDGLLPKMFSDIHPRFQTPWKGTAITGTCVGLISSLIPLDILVEFVSIGTLLAFTFVCVAVMVLRYTAPQLHRPFRCPWVPIIPIGGALCCLLLMFSLPATNWYRLLAWFGIGVVIYVFYGRRFGIEIPKLTDPPAQASSTNQTSDLDLVYQLPSTQSNATIELTHPDEPSGTLTSLMPSLIEKDSALDSNRTRANTESANTDASLVTVNIRVCHPTHGSGLSLDEDLIELVTTSTQPTSAQPQHLQRSPDIHPPLMPDHAPAVDESANSGVEDDDQSELKDGGCPTPAMRHGLDQ